MNDFFSRFTQFTEYYGVNKASELSKKTGLQHQTVSNYLKGRKPDADSLAIIQQTFENLDMCWLLTGKGQMLKSGDRNEINEPPPTYGCGRCRENEVLINQLIGENNVLREQLNLPIPERNKKVS